MPIYEYECPACGKVIEQVVLNPQTEVLPKCVHYTVGTDGETHYPMHRVQFSKSTGPNGLAVFFRGSGFYENDYKRKPK